MAQRWVNIADDGLTLVLLDCLFMFFRHFKLELLTQFPASNDEKISMFMNIFMKNRHLQY